MKRKHSTFLTLLKLTCLVCVITPFWMVDQLYSLSDIPLSWIERLSCHGSDREYITIWSNGNGSCELINSDEGKACVISTDCEGYCETLQSIRESTNVEFGTCSRFKRRTGCIKGYPDYQVIETVRSGNFGLCPPQAF